MEKEKRNNLVPNGKDLVRRPKLQDIFSKYLIRGISTWEEVACLGRNNLKYLLSMARSTEKRFSSQIHTLKEKQKMFEGHDGQYFKKLAQNFHLPEIKNKGVHPIGGWMNEDEPLGIEHEQREADSTTFNLCGWCEHSSGSHRFQYCISGSCHLLTEMRENSNEDLSSKYGETPPYYSHEVKFDTPCLLHSLTKDQCNGVVNGIMLNIGVLLAKREDVREAIRKLINLRNNSGGDKPWLVDFRPHDYMNIGDGLVAYIGNWKDKKVVEGDWVNAIGIFGYRHHDGYMGYQAEFPIHKNMSYFEGRGGGASMARPEVLLRSEFYYLHNLAKKFDWKTQIKEAAKIGRTADEDIVFLDIWFRNIDAQNLKGFDPARFYAALKNPKFVQAPKDWKTTNKEIQVLTVEDARKVLNMLNVDFFKTEKEIKAWVNMQLRYVHPDKLNGKGKETKTYAERQTKAVYAARDLLLKRLKK